MKTRFDSQHEDDPRPSRLVVERYRAALDDDDSDCSLAVVHYRGSREELEIGLEYTFSPDPKDRATGAHVLAQLGWSDQTFLEKSVDRLIELLSDEDPQVIQAAASALGHRGDARAIAHLLPLTAHPDEHVRFGTVFGLTGHEDDAAIAALITLTSDPDEDVRNWATFGLGSQIETDNAAIRQALWSAVDDSCGEIRGEALAGLAQRQVPGTIDAIIREWREHEEIGRLSIDAAGEFPGFPKDLAFDTVGDEMPLEVYRERLIEALEACRAATLAGTREIDDQEAR